MMMRNKSDEAEMTFFFLSLLLVKEGMDIYIYIYIYIYFKIVLLKIFERLIFFFFGLVAKLGFVGGKWGL